MEYLQSDLDSETCLQVGLAAIHDVVQLAFFFTMAHFGELPVLVELLPCLVGSVVINCDFSRSAWTLSRRPFFLIEA